MLANTKFESVKTNSDCYHLGELFAGAGGMALGAEKAKRCGKRFQHVWVNDIDKDACDTFARNFPTMPRQNIVCDDVRNLRFSEFPAIDGLVFGFPCNDFSAVGDKKGISGSYGGLYLSGARALKALKPLFFVAENVSGIVSRGDDFNIILEEFKKAGYRLFHHLYRFEEYNVPQARHRIIIIGFRNDLGINSFYPPKPTSKEKPISCRAALAGISPDAPNNERTNQSSSVIERLKHIKPGQNAFTAALPAHLKINMKSNATISQVYRRLKPDSPSYTVTGSGGGGTHLYHWKENRALTNRERARLQTFPDNFVFMGGRGSVRKQIGMAVPQEGARAIFNAALHVLLENNIESQC